MKRAVVLTAALLLGLPGLLGTALTDDRQPDADPPPPKPKPVEPPRAGVLDDTIRKGIGFLLKDQNADGSWGTAERTKDLNIYAPVPGAHLAFRAADTALCVAALIETGGDRADVRAAIEKGEAWLL